MTAGANAKHLEGKLVSLVSGQCYQQFVKVPAAICLVHKEDTTAEEAASSFVNPITALCFIETLKKEDHKAIVHTAASSTAATSENGVETNTWRAMIENKHYKAHKDPNLEAFPCL